jgi:hypothetical protein
MGEVPLYIATRGCLHVPIVQGILEIKDKHRPRTLRQVY